MSPKTPATQRGSKGEAGRVSVAFTTDWVAQYGVGIVEAGYDRITSDGFAAARAWAESVGGTLVIEASPNGLRRKLGAWGSPPDSVELQRGVKDRFDPAGICNPGIFPGGI